jgi:hypothetical protein
MAIIFAAILDNRAGLSAAFKNRYIKVTGQGQACNLQFVKE